MDGASARARRRTQLSQHFLRDQGLAASLVRQSSISGGDLVVEIGPGRGALTRELAKRCGRLIAVELDSYLANALDFEFENDSAIKIVPGDFLRFDLPCAPYKAFGNVPFDNTHEIVRRLVESPVPPDDAYLIVRREDAERISGHPFASESQTSLLLKPWWHIEIVRRLRRSDFDPKPKVDSVFLWLARRPRPLVEQHEASSYKRFIKSSFGTRGNTLRRCLRPSLTGRQIGQLSSFLRFPDSAPPSALTFDQWLGLFRHFC